jgi:hypothetical protein
VYPCINISLTHVFSVNRFICVTCYLKVLQDYPKPAVTAVTGHKHRFDVIQVTAPLYLLVHAESRSNTDEPEHSEIPNDCRGN